MARYLTDLILRDEGDGVRYTVVEPFSYQSDLGSTGGGLRHDVPPGFVTDFASVPRGLWNVFNKIGPWNKAAVIHDYLYDMGTLPKFLCDKTFYEACGVSGVPQWKRWVLYQAVHIGGGKAWRDHRKRDKDVYVKPA